jgi:hypothetical protein
LRDADVMTDRDRFEVEDPCVLTDPRVVSDRQFPGPQHPNPVADEDVVSDLGSECSKQFGSEVGGQPPLPEQHVLDSEPGRLDETRSALVIPVALEAGQRTCR